MALMDVVSFVSCRWPLMAYAAGWTAVLTVAVAVASFSPEAAFVSAISTQSASPCKYPDLSIRLPLDIPAEILCFPANRFAASNIDLIVPPIFAALVVAASACLVRAVSLWDDDLPI